MTIRNTLTRLLPQSFKQAIRSRVGNNTQPQTSQTPAEAEPMARLKSDGNLQLFVLPGDIISDSIIAHGVWEAELTGLLLEDAHQGGLLVEVGANIGYFAMLWAKARPDNRVLAFEPVFRNISLFSRSIAFNGLDSQIDLLPVAAGSEMKISSFELGPEQQTGWGGIVPDPSRAANPAKVVVAPLDLLLAEVSFIDVLKIDVEGADTLVLQGCRKLLRQKRIGKIYYEQNRPRMEAINVEHSMAQNLLRDLGYDPRPLFDYSEEVVEWVATVNETRPPAS